MKIEMAVEHLDLLPFRPSTDFHLSPCFHGGQTIHDVVRRTRPWRTERVDMAWMLIAHCRDSEGAAHTPLGPGRAHRLSVINGRNRWRNSCVCD